MVALRQPKPTGIAALLLEHGIGFLYCFATLVIAVGIFRGETSVGKYFSLTKSRTILQETVTGLKAENEHLAGEIIQIKESQNSEVARRVKESTDAMNVEIEELEVKYKRSEELCLRRRNTLEK